MTNYSSFRILIASLTQLKTVNSRFNELRSRQIKKTFTLFDEASDLDICFMMDCTFSMQYKIDEVKNEINEFIKDLKSRNSAGQLRLSFVGYRDFKDSTFGLLLDFTSSADVFINHLDKIEAEGGGDECEDVLSGFKMATKLIDWSSKNATKLFRAVESRIKVKDLSEKLYLGPFTTSAETLKSEVLIK